MQAMNQTVTPSEDEIVADVIAVRESLGHIPSSIEYDREGKFSLEKALYHAGGSWDAVLAKADIDPDAPRGDRITREKLRDDLIRVAEELGYTPTLNEYVEHGEYGKAAMRMEFGLYMNAINEAGLSLADGKARETRYQIPTEELLDDFARVANQLGHFPTVDEYNKNGDHTFSTLFGRYDSLEKLAEDAGLDPESVPSTRGGNIHPPVEDLKEDIASVAEDLGHVPSVDEYLDNGEYSHATILRHLDSYREALQKAGLDPDELPGGGKRGRPATPRDKILDDLARVGNEFYDEFGRRPSRNEYNERSEYSIPTVEKRFDGDLGAGLDEVGVPGTGTGSEQDSADEDDLDDGGGDVDGEAEETE